MCSPIADYTRVMTFAHPRTGAIIEGPEPLNLKKEDLHSFICPISMEQFQEPVIDTCGHTFNKFHIESYFKIKTKDGKTFPCPLDPSKTLNFTDLKKNYSLSDAIEESDKVIAVRTKTLSQRIDALECQVHIILDALAKEAAKVAEENKRAEALKEQRDIYRKQRHNLENMSLCDRIRTVFFYSYLTTIQNRGIDSTDINCLVSAVLQKPV